MKNEDVYTIISEHMDLLAKNKLEKISHEMKISPHFFFQCFLQFDISF